jgi:ubiquinone/menaquinone biosynthesis C-methylase UbiE
MVGGTMKTDDQIRSEVREHYSAIARGAQTACCGPSTQAGCCAPTGVSATDATRRLGYSEAELAAAPDTANLGLGCGNPQAIADLRVGEVVVDLGAGGGFDAFLAARAVGTTGRVIGVDMSADMVALARDNATKHRTANVEFRLGEIEHLPLPDNTADVLISNCVINLAPDKRAVFADALRVLKPGGRIAISDIVALAPMPAALADDVAVRCGCVSGAALASDIEPMLRALGFTDISVEIDPASGDVLEGWAPGQSYDKLVASARIRATKPGGKTATKTAACCDPGCCA